MIKPEVFRKLERPWFKFNYEMWGYMETQISEDIYFCTQVKRAGFKMYVDFSVQCFHDKLIPLHWPREQLDGEINAEEWDVTSQAMVVERQ